MSSLRNSTFGKRVRASKQDTNPEDEPNKRQRINPIFDTSPTPSTSVLAAPAAITPSGPSYGDRFVPRREASEMAVNYNLRDENDKQPKSSTRIIQPESDALKGPSLNLELLFQFSLTISNRTSKQLVYIRPSSRSRCQHRRSFISSTATATEHSGCPNAKHPNAWTAPFCLCFTFYTASELIHISYASRPEQSYQPPILTLTRSASVPLHPLQSPQTATQCLQDPLSCARCPRTCRRLLPQSRRLELHQRPRRRARQLRVSLECQRCGSEQAMRCEPRSRQ